MTPIPESGSAPGRRFQLLEALNAFAIAQAEVGRLFARSHGLHPSDAAAILQIIAAEDRGTPLTPARLADTVSLTSGATSILLNRLEAAGHVTRTRESRDRRVVTLRSTPSIHRAANDYYQPIGDELCARLGGLTDDQIDLAEHVVALVHRQLVEILGLHERPSA